MGAIGLNPIRLDRIGLDPIRINAIKLGVPGAASVRPYIDPEVLASLKAVCICYGKSNDDPDRAVVKNLVDPDNPFIISNAAYKLNSGYGLYGMDFLEWKSNSGMNFTSTKLTSTKPNLSGRWLTFRNVSGLIPETKVKVSGAPREFVFIGNNNGTDDKFSVTINNGVYTIPEFTLSSASGFYINNNSGDWSNLVIEQIPSYQGAFVTDGIDDLITSTKTVQEMLGGSNEITVVSMIHQIKESIYNNRAYTNYISGTSGHIRNQVADTKTGIYGYTVTDLNNSSTNIKGSVINNILGDKNDYLYDANTSAELGNAKYSVQNYLKSDGTVSNIGSQLAWYWTIIANKVLTTDQINQVIAYFNLDRTLKSDIYCNIAKQGITNENHAEFGDKLIDFSGNGRDIQLNNIAWKGDSGIGKYATDFTSWLNKPTETSHSKSILEAGNVLRTKSATSSMKVKVQFDKEAAVLSFRYFEGGVSKFIYINSNGEYSLPPLEEVGINEWEGFSNNSSSRITITQIPSHAGALCLDGVNDFGKVTGLPIYKDYTVVADREIETINGGVLSKSYVADNGSFIFEQYHLEQDSTSSFGYTKLPIDNLNRDRKISYQSKYSYNGTSLSVGTGIDGSNMWIATIRDNDSRFSNIAIYSLMTFPYSMSEFLIERQLKKHKLGTLYPGMVEFRPVIKSNVELATKLTFVIRGTSTLLNAGDYIPKDSELWVIVTMNNLVDELTKFSINGKEITFSSSAYNPATGKYEFPFVIDDKSPQKIDITIYQPPQYLAMLGNSTLISNETLIKNE